MSRKSIIMIGLIGGTFPYIALALTCDNAYYIPLASLSGACDSALFIGICAYIADLVPSQQRAIANGRAMIFPFIVLSLSSPLGALCAEAYKETQVGTVFNIAACLSLLPVGVAFLFLAEPLRGVGGGKSGMKIDQGASGGGSGEEWERDGGSGNDGGGGGGTAAERRGEIDRGVAQGGRESLWNRQLVVLVILSLLINCADQGVHSLLILYISDAFHECTEECISFVLTLFSVAFAIRSPKP